jgi:WD40 repeat protein
VAEVARVHGRVFISYRREDTAYPAGWLFDRLASQFGRRQVFKDVESVELGDDFVDVITTAVSSCDVLLALIGERWVGITDDQGRRRLDDPDDFVRLEIETALAHEVRVIPILVGGARMPRLDEVPPSLAKLVYLQALEVSPSRFESDTNRLLGVLRKTLADAPSILPYKGLAPFQREDAELFFGRDALVDLLVARLQHGSTLVVGGPSGSGKSSVVRAGLLPALASGALPGSESWPVCLFTPGERPLSALSAALGGLSQDGQPPRPEALRSDPDAVKRIVGSAGVLVVVDQFEELFTLCGDSGERVAFLRVLGTLTEGRHTAARVVLAVRADFYGTCAAHPWLAAAINDNHVLVAPMSRDQLREAIEGPARMVGLHLDEGLVDRVLSDTGDDAGVLPLVSHALVETWLRREGAVLSVAAYEAAGGVAGAIGRTADDVWERLDNDEQRAARRLLLRLVNPGDGTPDTKRLLTWREVGDDPTTRLVLSRFADSRLLTVDDRGVQLAHEALLRTWGRLATWLNESRDEMRTGERIEDAAREWERQGRHPDLLYRGVPLAVALEWQAHHEGAVGEPAGSFLEAAARSRDAEARAAAERQQRTRRIRRRVLLALSTLTVVSLVTSVVAFGALGRSRRDERAARAATRLAEEQLARSLAASAVDLRESDPFLATVLAAEATARVDPSLQEARDALVQSRLALAGSRLVPFGDPLSVADAVAVAVAPAGDVAATGNRDGTLVLWDLAARRERARLAGPNGGINDLEFTADGRWLVAAGADRRVWRWSLDSRPPGPATALADTASSVWSVTAAPAGSTVAATTQSGEVWLLDVASGGALGEPLRPGSGELLSAAFSPDGATLLAASGRGDVHVWSLPSRELRFPSIRAHTSDVWELVTPPGSGPVGFITVSSDGTARMWDLATGARIGGGPFDEGEFGIPRGVRGATVAPDGDTLTFGGPDGAVYSWSLSGGRLLERADPRHRDRVIDAGRSADGLILLTLSDDRTVQVWTQRPRPGPVSSLARLDAQPSSIAADPGGDTVAVGAADGTVRLLEASTGRERSRLAGHDGPVTAVTFSGPGRVLTGDSAGTLREWEAAGGLRAERRRVHDGEVTALVLSEDRRLLATGAADGTVRLWDAPSLTPKGGPLGPLPASVTDVAMAATGGTVAASTRSGDVARWTTAGRPIGEVFRVTDDTVWAVALAGEGGRDEGMLAAAGADEVVSLWSPPGARLPRRAHDLSSHRGGALDVAFVDGRTVVASSGDGQVRFWDAASGRPIGPPLAVTSSPIWHLAVDGAGGIWTASHDGTVARIDALVLEAACAQAAASFDELQRRRILAGRPSVAC